MSMIRESVMHHRSRSTHERLLHAARRLFLRQGYVATSIEAILEEAGVSSRETLYRHYANKEQLFVDVLRSLSLDQPDFAAMVATLPVPHDLRRLRQALTTLAHTLLVTMSQPDYLALLRVLVAEAPRFPELGDLYFSAIPERGLVLILDLLHTAQARQLIREGDMEAAARSLLGGLLTYAIRGLLTPAGAPQPPPAVDRVDSMVDLVLRAVARDDAATREETDAV
jgi:TetR/AcrR family transcriptional regulator, mexJK operon transcriptional repressor